MRVGLLTLLTVAFVVLKLCGVIDWSWWLVLLPAYIGPAVGLLFLFAVVVIGFVGGLLGLIGGK